MHINLNLLGLAAGFVAAVNGDCAAGNAFESAGNWYCDAVQAIHYSPVGIPGTYQKITGMDVAGSVCTSETQSFAGPLSPLDEEVSLHFRGPLQLKQFAAYSVATNVTMSPSPPQATGTWQKERRGHGHQHFHGRRQNTVTATIDGHIDKWVNNWFGSENLIVSTTTVIEYVTAIITSTVVVCPTATDISTTSSTNNDQPLDTSTFANGTYARTGYYNSMDGTSDNLTFIGNYGGAGSGVFDDSFGASAAYLNSDGTGGATTSQILSDTTIPSAKEFAIFTGAECTETNSCGFVRPGSVAYHGFGGADKIFLFEFQMPSDGTTGFEGDMPAIWMLNAQIPRVLQYGQADCSCWPACGEFDIMEVLNSGSLYCKSTLHTNTPAGDSDYIQRPTESTMKLAVLFHAPTSGIRIQVLPDDYVFGAALAQSDIDDILSMTSSGPMLSNFQVSA